MDNIYLIMTGNYSDRRCVGYCTTEQEAQKYCAAKNSTGNYEDHDYEEVQCLDGMIQGNPMVGVTVKLRCGKDHHGWGVEYTFAPLISIKHPPKIYSDNKHDIIWIKLWQPEFDSAKANKVAQDALYKWMAEEEQRAAESYERLQKYLTEE